MVTDEVWISFCAAAESRLTMGNILIKKIFASLFLIAIGFITFTTAQSVEIANDGDQIRGHENN